MSRREETTGCLLTAEADVVAKVGTAVRLLEGDGDKEEVSWV